MGKFQEKPIDGMPEHLALVAEIPGMQDHIDKLEERLKRKQDRIIELEAAALAKSSPNLSIDTQAYRLAPGGEGEHAATWQDKPHRLIYDLCGDIERLNSEVDKLEAIIRTCFAVAEGPDGKYTMLHGQFCLEEETKVAIIEICKPNSDAPTAP